MLKKISNWLSKGEGILITFAVMAMSFLVIMITMGILSRFLTGNSIPWVHQFSEYMPVIIIFFSVSSIMRDDKHVSTELLLNALSPGIRKVFHYIRFSIASITSCLLFWFALKATISNYLRGTTIISTVLVPMYPLLAVISIGALFLLLRSLEKVIEQYMGEGA